MAFTPIPIGEIAFDRGTYHNARGHQQGRRATQTGHSRAEAREALTASERTQSNEVVLTTALDLIGFLHATWP